MSVNETQQKLLTILEHAQTAKPSEFRLILNWNDLKYCQHKVKSFKLLVKGLRRAADGLFKGYCTGVANSESDFVKLLAYQQLVQAVVFYENEIKVFLEMLDEYDTYLGKGNFLWAYLGGMRAEEDLRDFRK